MYFLILKNDMGKFKIGLSYLFTNMHEFKQNFRLIFQIRSNLNKRKIY